MIMVDSCNTMLFVLAGLSVCVSSATPPLPFPDSRLITPAHGYVGPWQPRICSRTLMGYSGPPISVLSGCQPATTSIYADGRSSDRYRAQLNEWANQSEGRSKTPLKQPIICSRTLMDCVSKGGDAIHQ